MACVATRSRVLRLMPIGVTSPTCFRHLCSAHTHQVKWWSSRSKSLPTTPAITSSGSATRPWMGRLWSRVEQGRNVWTHGSWSELLQPHLVNPQTPIQTASLWTRTTQSVGTCRLLSEAGRLTRCATRFQQVCGAATARFNGIMRRAIRACMTMRISHSLRSLGQLAGLHRSGARVARMELRAAAPSERSSGIALTLPSCQRMRIRRFRRQHQQLHRQCRQARRRGQQVHRHCPRLHRRYHLSPLMVVCPSGTSVEGRDGPGRLAVQRAAIAMSKASGIISVFLGMGLLRLWRRLSQRLSQRMSR